MFCKHPLEKKDVQSVLSISFKNGMKSMDVLLTPFRTETPMKPHGKPTQ